MALEKRNLYRLPWSMNDNAIAWLEVTDICNIHCEGCYRQHLTGHKTLDEIKERNTLLQAVAQSRQRLYCRRRAARSPADHGDCVLY